MQCGAEIIKTSKKQKFCSNACGDAYRQEQGKPPVYPSPSEREIEEINTEVMQSEGEYSSYGQHEAAKLEESRGEIHAPAGFTSYYEREKRRMNTNEKNPTA